MSQRIWAKEEKGSTITAWTVQPISVAVSTFNPDFCVSVRRKDKKKGNVCTSEERARTP